jgi:hypothetical protein
MLGDGVRLFDHPGGTNVRLERLRVSQAPPATGLWMRVVDSAAPEAGAMSG